ncbi:MAG: two-component system sensor histidine kinase NtrB [Desulfopila sp.]
MRKYLTNVSPLIFAAAFTLLAFIIGAFAITNYKREKALMNEALLQKGLAISRFVETGVRVSMRARWQGGRAGESGWLDHVQSVIDQLHDQTDLHFVELVAGDGNILAGSNAADVGKTVDSQTLMFLHGAEHEEFSYRMQNKEGEGRRGFQVARQFSSRWREPPGSRGMHGRMMDNMYRVMPESATSPNSRDNGYDQDIILLVELDLEQFDSAVHRQKLQLIILSVVLLLVGAGGWLSLLTLQGFKGSQSRLQRIRAFNDHLVEALPVGLIATDGQGVIQVVNGAAQQMVGTGLSRLLGKTPVAALPEPLARPFALLGDEPGKTEDFAEIVTLIGGEKRTLHCTAISVTDEVGGYSGDVVLLQDVSNLRQLEAELRRNERLAALGRMAAGVAHELRNPLSSIKGLAVLLKGCLGGDLEGQQTANVLVQEVERLNRSISELLDYARPEKLRMTTLALHPLLKKAIALVGVDAEAQKIEIELSLAAENDLVMADEDRMNQVFLNLLLNAIQAMPEGGRLQVATQVSEQFLVCTISDSGEGIAEENIARVFDPYFTTKNDGTGLGLALSAKIVEEHGGTISINSRQQLGTEVSVTLALAASHGR